MKLVQKEIKMSIGRVLAEAVVMGIIVVVLGYIICYFTEPYFGVALPDICSTWNSGHILEINLFLIGFVGHLAAEAFGLNKWYCRNGNACNPANL